MRNVALQLSLFIFVSSGCGNFGAPSTTVDPLLPECCLGPTGIAVSIEAPHRSRWAVTLEHEMGGVEELTGWTQTNEFSDSIYYHGGNYGVGAYHLKIYEVDESGNRKLRADKPEIVWSLFTSDCATYLSGEQLEYKFDLFD